MPAHVDPISRYKRTLPARRHRRFFNHCRLLACMAVLLGCAACAAPSTEPELPKSGIAKLSDAKLREDLERLYLPSALARARAATRLGSLGERGRPAIPYLASMLRDASRVEGVVHANPFFETPNQVAFHAAAALAEQGEPGVQALKHALEHGNDNAQRAAVYALGEAKVHSALPTLCRMLASSEPVSVRETIPLALQKIGDKAAVPALIQALLRKETARTVWPAAGAALSEMQDVRVIEPALAMLSDQSEAMRRHLAAQILGRIHDWPDVPPAVKTRVIAALAVSMRERNEVSIEARKALKELGALDAGT